MQFSADKTRLYVASGDDNRIDVVDVEKLEVVDSIPDIYDPEVFDIDPGGHQLYMSNEDAGMLSIIDLSSKHLVKPIKVGPEPEGVIVTPDGRMTLVASETASPFM